MINPKDHPAGTKVRLIDASGVAHPGERGLREGNTHEIEYWDGCCVCIKTSGIGPTLNRDRFTPITYQYASIDEMRSAASHQSDVQAGRAFPFRC